MQNGVKSEIERLREEIERHNRLYYEQARPEISDEEYDGLIRRLQRLEADHPEHFSPDSPTQRVGGNPSEGFAVVEHRVPMLSIDNTYSPAELREFHRRTVKGLEGRSPRYVVEPKIDGVSVSLTYKAGVLVCGATRGDGRRGDDVTANVRTMREIPLRIKANAPAFMEIRGEAYFTKADFEEINRKREAEGEPPFANPRNSAAGTLKMLDSRVVAKRPLRLFAYAFGMIEGLAIESQEQALEVLRSFGLPVNPETKCFDDFDALIEHVLRWADRREHLPYQVDGMVIKVDRCEDQRRLGATSKAPRWQVAYKYAPEQAATRLLAVEVQVGRTGALTPVAVLDPVQLSGTTVSRASLHNFDETARKDVRIGDLVIVEKAGEIIPQVIAVKMEHRPEHAKPILPPSACPVCQGEVRKDEGGVSHRCVNPSCPAQLKNTIEFFASRSAMDIEGLGPAIIDQLVDAGLVGALPDLYRLRLEQLTPLDRMGEKSAQKLIASIADSKSRGLSRLLVGLGIRHIGKRTAEILANHFGSVDALMAADRTQLETIPEIGPVLADSVHRYFHEQGGKQLVAQLADLGLKLIEDRSGSGAAAAPFAGKSIVVTGKLARFSREEIERLIQSLGGKASSSVSSRTAYVVAGDEAGSKLDKARKLGVTVLSEEEFLHLAGGAPQ